MAVEKNIVAVAVDGGRGRIRFLTWRRGIVAVEAFATNPNCTLEAFKVGAAAPYKPDSGQITPQKQGQWYSCNPKHNEKGVCCLAGTGVSIGLCGIVVVIVV